MSEKLKKIRRSLMLNQAELGLLIGVHSMTVSKWERGLLKPTAHQNAVIDVLEITGKNQTVQKKLKQTLISKGVIEAQLLIYRNLTKKATT
jgi:DNA-binding transcriptional regulator YiaG